MLLIYGAENAWDEASRAACYDESTHLAHTLQSEGVFLGTAPLHSVTMATTVQVRDGKRVVTDGPFAETREQLGGFFMIDARDLDHALDIAARIPGARVGKVEVRPVVELDGIPDV